jgi:hypothetical protein
VSLIEWGREQPPPVLRPCRPEAGLGVAHAPVSVSQTAVETVDDLRAVCGCVVCCELIADHARNGVRGRRGDFEPLISEDLFYRVQAVLSGRVPSTTPQQRAPPDFPLRALVRCESCGRGLTGSSSRP